MEFLGETRLMPQDVDFPDTFSFVKIVPETKYENDEPIGEYIEDGIRIKVSPGHNTYFKGSVMNFRAYKDKLTFAILTRDDEIYNLNSDEVIFIEVDKVPGRVINQNLENIGDAEENELIEELRRKPSLVKKIPQVLWDRTNFQRKIVSANLKLDGKYIPQNVKTMARMRRNNSVSNKTGTLDTDLLPDGPLSDINKYLGIETPQGLDAARLKVAPRAPPQENARSKGWLSRMFGKGVTRNRTRRFKK
jgi:hypothetical protein